MSAVELVDIKVVYTSRGEPDHVALDGLSLKSDNEMLALLGPNGAGKSSLMGVITQTVHPVGGRVISPSTRQGLSIVFQTPALDKLLTVRENLQISGALHGLSKGDCASRITELATELGIEDRLDTQVRRLSGGLARRADLARALVPQPSVLLLDEPTTGLDIDARRSFWESMDCIRSQSGMTVMLATHLIDEAERADRVAMIADGKCVALGTPDALRAQLGERLLSIRSNNSDALGIASNWLSSIGREPHRFEHLIMVPHAGDIDIAQCPIDDVAVTIAPPTLEDAYTLKTNAGVLA